MRADLRTSIAKLLRADLTAEADAGFPTARRIPSTDAIEFLDYFDGLDVAGRTALLDAMARSNALMFFPTAAVYQESLELNEKDPALVQFREARTRGPLAYGLRYLDLRMARNALKDPESMSHMAVTRSKLDFVPRDDPPPELMPEPDRLKVVAAKAPLLRKLIDRGFAQLFAPAKSKTSGVLQYTGRIGSTELKVSVVFSALYAQMSWWLGMEMANPNLKAIHVRDFWGARAWNYLTEENAPRSIELLCERVTYWATMRKRIDGL